MYKNKYINALINFVKNNPKDYEEKLLEEPYNLKNILTFPNNPTWKKFNYNLFGSDLSLDIVKACRGTVLEINGDEVKVIAAPYTKFFDINDPHADKINWDSPKLKCFSKIDGQLLSMFKHNGRDYWMTNGGTGLYTPIDYESDDVKNYKELVAKCLLPNYSQQMGYYCKLSEDDFQLFMPWVYNVPDGWTLMFEITSPQNRIICKYDEYKIWFHGARDAEGVEHSAEEIKRKFYIPYDIPHRYNLSNKEDILSVLATFNGLEHEGFVVVDEQNWTRVKMKCPSYLALKYVKDNDTPEGIWRLCINENHDDFPELKEKTDKQVEEINKFNKDFIDKLNWVKCIWEETFHKNRKEFACWVNSHIYPTVRAFCFKIADGIEPQKNLENFWEKTKIISDGYDRYCKILEWLKGEK